MSLTNKTIFKFLKNIPNFIGVFSRDKLFKVKRKNYSLVINTDPSYKPGEHWVAIVCRNKHAVYFDSYGQKPKHEEIKKFLNTSSVRWTFNKTKFQSILTSTCGYYVILFVAAHTKGVSLKKFVNLFSVYTPANDKLIQMLL
jgi:hypothetical protein